MSYNTSNYTEQGGDRTVVGGSLDVISGAELDVEYGASLKFAGAQQPVNITLSAAASTSNVCDVTATVVDGSGAAIAKPFIFDLWLSDAATGAGLTGTSASGTVTAKSASGVVIDTYTSKKALRVQSLATGVFTLAITDSSKTGFYVAAELGGILAVSDQLETADYG